MSEGPISSEELRRLMREAYEAAFQKYRNEWEETKRRVEAAEKVAEAAKVSSEAVLLTLKAFGKKVGK